MHKSAINKGDEGEKIGDVWSLSELL